jgi:hypothetical protein
MGNLRIGYKNGLSKTLAAGAPALVREIPRRGVLERSLARAALSEM